MALLHQAELRPSKKEIVATWLPSQPWYRGPAPTGLRRIASYRFDDPAGEVGIEALVVDPGDGALIQVPMTYRGAPLEGAQAWLIGTMHHSVLGDRWVYNACGDPVYVSTLAHAIATGASQADEYIEIDGEMQRQEPTMVVRGSGSHDSEPGPVGAVEVIDGDPARIRTETLELAVIRGLDLAGASPNGGEGLTLTGTWKGQAAPVLLARLQTL
jgi:hypothetical protein